MRRTAVNVVALLLLLPAAASPASAASASSPAVMAPPTGAAPDGPGALSRFDLARKDCFGTAANRTSKV